MTFQELMQRFNTGEVLREAESRQGWNTVWKMGRDRVSRGQAERLQREAQPYHKMPSQDGGYVYFKTLANPTYVWSGNVPATL